MIIDKIYENFSITVEPIQLNGLRSQIDKINAEINRAFQLKEKSEIGYMKEISKKFNKLKINGEEIPFELVIGGDDSALADYDMSLGKINYYWGNKLKRIDLDVVHHEAYHHLQMENLLNELSSLNPEISRKDLRKKIVSAIVQFRKNQEKFYDSKYGEGTTYRDLYFSTAKEVINYSDYIARDFARYMKNHQDYLFLYHLKNLANDFDVNKSNMDNYTPKLKEMSKFYINVTRKFAKLASLVKEKHDLTEARKVYWRLLEKLIKGIVYHLQRYVDGQDYLEVMQEKIAIPRIDTNTAFRSGENLKNKLFDVLNRDDTNKALYQKLVKNGYYENPVLNIKLDNNYGVRVPVILVERGSKISSKGSKGAIGIFKNSQVGLKLGLILNHRDQRIVNDYEYGTTIDHEITHLLQDYSVALKYLQSTKKKIDNKVLEKTLFRVVKEGAPSKVVSFDALDKIKYFRKPNEMGARAMILYKALLKNRTLLNKIVDYIEKNNPRFEDLDRIIKRENLPGYKDFVTFSNNQMDATGDLEQDTAGWELRQELLNYFYKIYQQFYKDKGVRNAYK